MRVSTYYSPPLSLSLSLIFFFFRMSKIPFGLFCNSNEPRARPIQSLMVGLEQAVIYTCRSFMDALNTFVSTFSPLCHELSPNPAAAVSVACLAFSTHRHRTSKCFPAGKDNRQWFPADRSKRALAVFYEKERGLLLFAGEPRLRHARLAARHIAAVVSLQVAVPAPPAHLCPSMSHKTRHYITNSFLIASRLSPSCRASENKGGVEKERTI